MSVKIQIPGELIVKNLVNRHNLKNQIDSIFSNEKPFQKGRIDIDNLILIRFDNSEGEWTFIIETENRCRAFAVTKEHEIKAIQPQEPEWWFGKDNGQSLIYVLSAFKLVQGRAYRNKKILFTEKEYEMREHKFEPREINKPIILEDTIQVIFSSNTEETRDYVRHIEAWGVRGHERHYKNGKVVFIKPYTKGKGKPKETVYEIT